MCEYHFAVAVGWCQLVKQIETTLLLCSLIHNNAPYFNKQSYVLCEKL